MNTPARFIPPLISWDIIRNGKLYLQKPDSIIEIAEVWPKPTARASTRRRPEWHTCKPKIQLDSITSPYGEFFRVVPATIRSTLGRFPGWHWELLSGVAKSAGVLELLHANPALGLMSQVYWEFQAIDEQSVEYAASLATRRQRDIAGALGFPAMKWVVRVLAKIPVESLHIRDLLTIRRLTNDTQSAKWLRHVARLNGPLLCLMSDPHLRRAISWQLINDLARNHNERTSGETVMRLIELEEYRRCLQRPTGQPYQTVNEVADAWRAFQETRRAPRQVSGFGTNKLQFPIAPLPNDSSIIPLLSRKAIALEGNEQDNCVASYISAARRGQVYLFKVFFPERATVAVKRRRGQWYCAELKGPRNRPVRSATRTYIRRWLTRANAGNLRTSPIIQRS